MAALEESAATPKYTAAGTNDVSALLSAALILKVST